MLPNLHLGRSLLTFFGIMADTYRDHLLSVISTSLTMETSKRRAITPEHVEKIINEDIVNDVAMNQYIDSFEIDIASSDEDSS